MAFWRSYAHLVWATKNRQPWIDKSWEDRLYGQMIKKASELGCYVYAVNGAIDHGHIVLTTPPKHSISHIVKELKGSSSHFINHIVRPAGYHFAWQRGYGYVTLGQSQLDRAIAYVERQKEHHANSSTNGWLERYTNEDEGPDMIEHLTTQREDGVKTMAEPKAVYNAFGEFPF